MSELGFESSLVSVQSLCVFCCVPITQLTSPCSKCQSWGLLEGHSPTTFLGKAVGSSVPACAVLKGEEEQAFPSLWPCSCSLSLGLSNAVSPWERCPLPLGLRLPLSPGQASAHSLSWKQPVLSIRCFAGKQEPLYHVHMLFKFYNQTWLMVRACISYLPFCENKLYYLFIEGHRGIFPCCLFLLSYLLLNYYRSQTRSMLLIPLQKQAAVGVLALLKNARLRRAGNLSSVSSKRKSL